MILVNIDARDPILDHFSIFSLRGAGGRFSGVRYRYYVSLPHLHGESKTASVGSVSRIPATEIEDVIVKS
jgi:hypothetical protein